MDRGSGAALRPAGLPLAGCLLLGVLFTGCAAPELDVNAMVRDWANYMQSDYVLRPNDSLSINIAPDGETQTLVVPPTGRLNLQRIEEPIEAVGRPVRVFRAAVQEAYRKVYRDDIIVQVSLLKTGASSIYVVGEVNRPGPTPYVQNMTLSQAIAAAGGVLYRAKLQDVRIVRPQPTGMPKTYRVNADRIFHADRDNPDFLVLPGDVVYCQSLWVAELSDVLNLYLWSLLPFRAPTSFATAGL